MSKKSKLIIAMVIIATFIITISASYAYYTAAVTGNDTATTSTVTTGTMSINYVDGPDVSAGTLIPGNSVTKTFSVKNTGNINTTYTINFSDLVNNFADTSDLVYSISSSDGGANITQTEIPTTSKKISNEITIAPNVTHNYTLIIKFLDTLDNQNDNQNKEFRAKITINDVTNILVYKDKSDASSPELVTGMVPVKYNSEGQTVVADLNYEWYDYNKHEWANAVLVNSDTYRTATAGTVIPEDNILQYYVWIPRYRYLLWNTENGSSNPQMIDIKFEDKLTTKSSGSHNGEWLTHPAFTFGDTELNGIWVGKFENSTSDPSCQGVNESTTNCNKSTLPITIKPNQSSWVNITVSNQFASMRNTGTTNATTYGLTSSEVDTHMLKNMEWGAVAYLTSSIYGRYNDASTCIASGCEVWINNIRNNSTYYASTTGCSGTSVSAGAVVSAICPAGYDWINNGVNASTTGNQYGIYDMSGGSWEYTMGNVVDTNGNFYSSSAGFSSAPDTKYFDSYAYGTSETDHARGLLGDATRETLKTFGSTGGGWNGDYAGFPYSFFSWFLRGGSMGDGSSSGMFGFYRGTGGAYNGVSSRSALVSVQ